MNYLKEILAFNDRQLSNPLSTGQIALWYALMHVNNKCAWKEWFTVASITLELHTGLSRDGMIRARNVLKQYGFIDFKSNNTKATAYRMLSIANNLQASLQDNLQVSLQDSLQNCTPLNKQNKTKLSSDCSVSFDKFWSIYPKKVSKAVAEKAFMKINPDDDLLSKMISALEKQSKSAEWTKENGQFIPHPATWLNGKRWEDEAVERKENSNLWGYYN